MRTRIAGLVALSLICTLAVFGAGVAGSVEAGPDDGDAISLQSPDSVTIDDGVTTAFGTAEDGTEVDILVGLESDDAVLSRSDRLNPDQLRESADSSQANLERYAATVDGITVEQTFWLTNLAAVSVDPDRVTPSDIASIAGVESIYENAPVRLYTGGTDSASVAGEHSPVAAGSAGAGTATVETTYGLEQIGATDVWDTYGTRGENTSVAVLDTGIDPDHPDLDLEDFAKFDFGDGEVNETAEAQDFDPNGHGTHVSGTVTGGNESGQYIGVAPDATLYHAAVLPDCNEDECIGLPVQIIGGMEWAVENDVDVMSLSLGIDSTGDVFVDAVRNARQAGTSVAISSGNDGERTSGTPANVYDAISVGASNDAAQITTFSSGEFVDTNRKWTDPPADWPDEYVVPTISAPGRSVHSAMPGGDYSSKSGTSMASPHVNGAIALITAATNGTATPTEIETALERTATKPDETDTPAGERDIRYGSGIIDVPAAIEFLEQDPTAAFRYQQPRPAPGETVTFDGTYSIGDIETYEWDFGDGTTETVAAETATDGSLTHTFEEGQYDVTLTVTDTSNETETTTRTVAVRYPSVEQRWTADLDAHTQSSATVSNVTVRDGEDVTVGPVAFVGSNDGAIYAFDAETGAKHWRVQTEASLIPGSPTVVDETVYVGGFDGAVYALDAATGDQRWKETIGPSVRSSPTVANVSTGGSPKSGTVVVGSNDDHVYALDTETGERHWRFETGGQVRTSPTIVDDTIFVGSDDGTLYALPASPAWENGTYTDSDELWAVDTSGQIRSSPTVWNDSVYFGSDDGHLYAVNRTTGGAVFEEYIGFDTEIRSSPTVANGTVFVGASDESVYAFDAVTGEEHWEFVTGNTVESSPTVVGETVLVGSDDRRMYGIDAATGAKEWRFFVNGSIDTSPTVVDGTVYFGSLDEQVYALDVNFADATRAGESSAASDGTRVLLGTLGHHGTWANQDVVGPPRVTGQNWPRDLTGDGLYEDIRGSGELDIFDVQALFTNLASDPVQTNAAYYNFQGGETDTVTVFDVQSLFTRVGSGIASA